VCIFFVLTNNNNNKGKSLVPLTGPKDIAAPKYFPSKIVIIRNAESENGILSKAGIIRSQALASWTSPGVDGTPPIPVNIQQAPGALLKFTNGKQVAAIYTPIPTEIDQSQVLTSAATVFNLRIPVYTISKKNDTAGLLAHIYSNPLVQDKVVLIIWDHTCIQQLMAELGMKAPLWTDDNYSRVYVSDILTDPQYILACENFDNVEGIQGKDSIICAEPLIFKNQICVD
jgi:hypothetical protein